MFNRSHALATVMLIGLLSSACGGSPATAPAATTAPTAVPAAPTSVPTAVPTQAPTQVPTQAPAPTAAPTKAAPTTAPTQAAAQPATAAAQPTQAAATGNTASDSGLAALASYRLNTILKVDVTTAAGKTQTATLDIKIDQVKEPPASHLLMTGLGSLGGNQASNPFGDQLEMYVITSTAYIKLGDQWISSSSKDAEQLAKVSEPFQASKFLQGVNAKQVGGEDTVNGVKAKHYTFTEKDLTAKPGTDSPLSGIDTLQGEYWTASQGGYIVKYSVKGQGSDIQLSDEIKGKGTLQIDLNVSDVNKPISITPPKIAGTIPGLTELPVPNGGTVTATLGDLATVETSQGTVKEVAAFYEKALSDQGFKKQGGGLSSDTFQSDKYSKDNVTIDISVTSKDGKNTVLLSSTSTK